MRFYRKPEPADGEIRTVSAFLWLPKTIGDETRFLERARWTEKYYPGMWLTTCDYYLEGNWKSLCWLPDEGRDEAA